VVKGIRRCLLSAVFVAMLLCTISLLLAQTGEPASDFSLSGLGNKHVSLSDFKGKPVILFFWTTWCPFCGQELKALNTMQARMAKDGVALLAINVGEPFYKVENLALRYNFTFTILLDTDSTVADAYGILGVPTYIHIDKEGNIISTLHSFSDKKYKELITR
jgi:peroxiredoxin